MLSVSYNFKKINPKAGGGAGHTSVSNVRHLGPKGSECVGACRAAARAGLAAAPSQPQGLAGVGGSLSSSWLGASVVKRALLVRGSHQGDQRGNNGHWSPLHVIMTSSRYQVSTSGAQLEM